MLHIVQVVLSGNAEIPKLFFDEAAAEAAYVACAKEYWANSYPAYCDRNGVSQDSFLSAKAFVKSFDRADKSRIQYWIVKPEESGLDTVKLLLSGAESGKERREHILRLTKEVEQTSRAVKEGLTELLDTIAELSDSVTGLDVTRTDDQYAGRPEVESRLPSSPLPHEEPVEVAEKYKRPEWKKYVESVKNMCGGSSGEFRLFTRHDWRQDVYSNLTSFEYWEWVAAKIDTCTGKAEKAGYSVVEDSDQPGQYKFKTPDAIWSKISCNTEEEAWCHACLHSDG